MVSDVIYEENLSTLTVKYRHPKNEESRREEENYHHQQEEKINEFVCRTKNIIGISEEKYEIKVGKPPITPDILSYSYQSGTLFIAVSMTLYFYVFIYFLGNLTLQLLQQVIEPPIDLYRIELANQIYIEFNASK